MACRSLFGKRQEQHWEHQNQIQKDLKMQVGRYPPSLSTRLAHTARVPTAAHRSDGKVCAPEADWVYI